MAVAVGVLEEPVPLNQLLLILKEAVIRGAFAYEREDFERAIELLDAICDYELTSLRMTGRSWCHRDLPADIPQYFVSELHADRFSEPFQEAAVTGIL